jgi:hypothetical protein
MNEARNKPIKLLKFKARGPLKGCCARTNTFTKLYRWFALLMVAEEAKQKKLNLTVVGNKESTPRGKEETER